MSNELHAMKKTHRAIEHSLDAIDDLVDEIEEGCALKPSGRRALKAHVRLLMIRLSEHLEREEAATQSAERWLAGRPEGMHRLHAHIEQLHDRLKGFSTSVRELDDGIELGSESWQNTRDSLAEFVDLFRHCTEREWQYYSQYSTLLEPGGISS